MLRKTGSRNKEKLREGSNLDTGWRKYFGGREWVMVSDHANRTANLVAESLHGKYLAIDMPCGSRDLFNFIIPVFKIHRSKQHFSC